MSLLLAMSGAEALVVLSILANVLSVVEFSNKAIDRVKESLEDIHDLPKAFRDLQTLVPLVLNTLHKTEQQAHARELDETTCKALIPVIEQCGKTLAGLNGILNKVIPAEGSSRWKRTLKAMSSLGQDKKVEEIVKAIETYISLLTYHHVATAPTTTQITSIVAGITSMTIPVTPAPAHTLKTFYMVPIQWSDDFTGRDDVLDTLCAKLCLTDRHSRIALVGLGGIGKTRIALQFAVRFKSFKDISVFWVHVGNAERFKKSYLDIAKRVAMLGWDDPQINVFQLVKDWFEGEGSGRWLLVIDNADDMEMLYGPHPNGLGRYFPRSDNGSILMTTRYRKVGVKFTSARNTILIPALSAGESMRFLGTRLGDEVREDSSRRELAEELENIPLALVQASSFITENQISAERYLQLYRDSDSSKMRLLTEDFEDDTRDREIKNPLATTWAISFDYIRKHDTAAADILSMMSMLDAQSIPESLLSSIDDSLNLEKALGTLKAFSLISLRNAVNSMVDQDERAYDLHRLVRLAMRNWLHMRNSFDLWTAKAIKVLSDRYPSGWNETRAACFRYLPHAMVLLSCNELKNPLTRPSAYQGQVITFEQVSEGRKWPPCTASLFLCVARTLDFSGDYYLKRLITQRALVISRNILGDLHGITQDILLLRAEVLFRLEDYTGAERAYRQLIDCECATLGSLHPLTLSHTSSLSVILDNLGLVDEGMKIRNDVFVKCTEVLGPKHPETLVAMSQVASGYAQVGRHSEAYVLAMDAMKLYYEVGWKEVPERFFGMEFLEDAFSQLDCHAELEYISHQWYTVTQRSIEEEHQATLPSLMTLVLTYEAQQMWDKAEQLLVSMLKRSTETRSRKHPFVTSIVRELAHIYLNHQGRFVEAEELYVSILQSQLETYGERHEDSIESMEELAFSYEKQARYREAVDLRLRALELQEQTIGEKHSSTIDGMLRLADSFIDQQLYYKAEELVLRVLESRRQILGEKHADTIDSMAKLASTFEKQARYPEAAELRLKAVELQKQTLGEMHRNTIHSMNSLATSYFDQELYNQAEEIEAKVLEFRKEILGDRHPRTLAAMWDLSVTMTFQNRITEAVCLASSTITLCKEVYNEGDSILLWYKDHYENSFGMGNNLDETSSESSDAISDADNISVDG